MSAQYPSPVSIIVKVGFIGILSSCVVHAQTVPQAAPSEPSAPHEKLRFFEGTWTTSDSTPEQAFRESCAWLPEGRRHMVCRSRWKTVAGPREGMSIFSYDPATGEYVYNGFRAGGAHVTQRGSEEDGRWVFRSESGKEAERVRSRVTIEPNQQGGFAFLSEVSAGVGPWKEQARFTYVRLPQ
jgi:hypothetical protein